jgi:hypothetical protein
MQTASPVCGIKNFSSVRLYSAPQLHCTIVAILRICAPCPASNSATIKLTHSRLLGRLAKLPEKRTGGAAVTTFTPSPPRTGTIIPPSSVICRDRRPPNERPPPFKRRLGRSATTPAELCVYSGKECCATASSSLWLLRRTALVSAHPFNASGILLLQRVVVLASTCSRSHCSWLDGRATLISRLTGDARSGILNTRSRFFRFCALR